jgi:hypothetical protein
MTYSLKQIKPQKTSKKWRFCPSDVTSVMQFCSKAFLHTAIKFPAFWHQNQLSTTSVSGDTEFTEKQKNRKTEKQKDRKTEKQTDGHKIFYCFIVLRDVQNVEKTHKKWGSKNFFFRVNLILRRISFEPK